MEMFSLRIDGAKVRNADFYHKATRVSLANIVPLTEIGEDRKRVFKGKTSTSCTATPNRLLLLNERKTKLKKLKPTE